MRTTSPPLTLTQTRLLATVINTTRNMLGLAAQADWDAVADLELLRREDLKACFEIPVHEDQGDLVAEGLAVLLHLNEELMSKLAVARDQVAHESATHSRKTEAVDKYQKMH